MSIYKLDRDNYRLILEDSFTNKIYSSKKLNLLSNQYITDKKIPTTVSHHRYCCIIWLVPRESCRPAYTDYKTHHKTTLAKYSADFSTI